MPGIITNLWFDTEGEEAAEFYCSVFPNSKIVRKTHYTESGPRETGMVMTVDFELDGKPFTAINGGPEFKPNESVSLLIECSDQKEIDHYWDKLTDGGREVQCGWLTDRYGFSWQVVPKGMDEVFEDDDPARADRAMKAMLKMVKIDVAALKAAADG
jgi:predicted 3-demethylubiquinone-9 3-methyltransferase (glyoxalase superfamily)